MVKNGISWYFYSPFLRYKSFPAVSIQSKGRGGAAECFAAVLLAAAAVAGDVCEINNPNCWKMAQFINLTFFSSLPHVAAASLMCIEMIGWAGVVADGWMGESAASGGCGDGFSVVDAFVDVGGGADEQGMFLVLCSTPAMSMGVERWCCGLVMIEELLAEVEGWIRTMSTSRHGFRWLVSLLPWPNGLV